MALHSGHIGCVSMRRKLWRFGAGQLGSAASKQVLGAELVQQGWLNDLLLHLHSPRGAKDVGVASEGQTPAEDAEVEQSIGLPKLVGASMAPGPPAVQVMAPPESHPRHRATINSDRENEFVIDLELGEAQGRWRYTPVT